MKCDFDYCIYTQNFECYFSEVGINALSMCEECTIVSLQEKKLEKYKKGQLREIISRYTDSEE